MERSTPDRMGSNGNCSNEMIEFVCTNSIEDNHFIKSPITIFPNPFRDVLHVQQKGGKIEHVGLYNEIGQIMPIKFVKNYDNIQIDTSKLPKGIYFIRIETSNQIQFVKCVK